MKRLLIAYAVARAGTALTPKPHGAPDAANLQRCGHLATLLADDRLWLDTRQTA